MNDHYYHDYTCNVYPNTPGAPSDLQSFGYCRCLNVFSWIQIQIILIPESSCYMRTYSGGGGAWSKWSKFIPDATA